MFDLLTVFVVVVLLYGLLCWLVLVANSISLLVLYVNLMSF